MEVMSIGPVEILVVLLVAFLVLGPQRMIKLAASFGKFAQEVKKTTRDIFDMATLENDQNKGNTVETQDHLDIKPNSTQESDKDQSIER